MHPLASAVPPSPQLQRPAHRVLAHILGALAAAVALLVATTSPASAATGTWTGDWNNNDTALKRVVTCIVVTYQQTGSTGGNLNQCTGSNDASSNSYWDNNGLFPYTSTLDGENTTSKDSDGCPDANSNSTYVKCIFINSDNIVVTVSETFACCPRISNRDDYARWARIN